jgi:hypothetical protein
MTIEAALRRTCELLQNSEDSDWTPWTAAEILGTLEAMLQRLGRGEEIDRDELRLLFLPTGAVQETSMANGWSKEMLVLGEAVDRYLGDL